MTRDEVTLEFLKRIPFEYPKHMLCAFAREAAAGRNLPFLEALVGVLARIDTVNPGYAVEMLNRIAGVTGTGEHQYEAILQVLAEIYVTGGVLAGADVDAGKPCFAHEPAAAAGKNPECEVRIAGRWCAIEVKMPKLINHRNNRTVNPWQLTARIDGLREQLEGDQTLPRDNPVKDFLILADAKFAAYERYRRDALRLATIVWDDFCNEPIAALLHPAAGLLTPASFYKDGRGSAVAFPHIDGVIIIRHHHQLLHATRCEPLVDGLRHVFDYHHRAFPPKAFIAAHGGRAVPPDVLAALDATPLSECPGAEYHPSDLVMWVGDR